MSSELFSAIRDKDMEVLSELLATEPEAAAARVEAAQGEDPAAGGSALHVAVEVGSAEAARLLIEAGVDLEARNAYGRTALHDAIEYGRHTIEELLLAAGAEVDVCAAAILGRAGRLRELLDADPELANDRSTGLSPLGWAAYGNEVETARELLARGARMDDGELLCAASVCHMEVGRFLLDHLLERGADLDAIEPHCSGNALHEAAGMRYSCDTSAFVRMLLEAGADPAIRNRDGKTALEVAEEGDRRQREAPESVDFVRDYAAVAAILRAVADHDA